MQYKEICLAAYRGLVQPESEDKRIISAQWAKDDDISRFLRSLPNWVGLRAPDGGDLSKVRKEGRKVRLYMPVRLVVNTVVLRALLNVTCR